MRQEKPFPDFFRQIIYVLTEYESHWYCQITAISDETITYSLKWGGRSQYIYDMGK